MIYTHDVIICRNNLFTQYPEKFDRISNHIKYT